MGMTAMLVGGALVGSKVIGSMMPKPPAAPPPPPAPPTMEDPGVQKAAEEERRRQQMARGRASTVLTGPQGLAEEPGLARRTLTP